MRAYYGSRFSPNQTVTPEGFLICHNVPVARTGWYEYLGEEIGEEDLAGKAVRVFRSPEEVFSPAAMASFEGKVLTDEHPPDAVTPENATRYTKGTVQNVRQGTGDDSDLLIADLVVYDQQLINEIQDGKREVSAGYDCTYADSGNGTYEQQQICGNHVAVVKKGRAGDRVAIKDSVIKNPNPEGVIRMAKINLPRKKSRMTDFLAAVGLKHFATDADPEEIMDAVSEMAEEKAADEGVQDPPVPNQDPAKDADPAVQALTDQVGKLTALVEQLLKAEKQEKSPEDSIDAAIAELEKGQQPAGDTDEEESHTIPAETLDDDGPVTAPEDRPKSAITGDNRYRIDALRAMKPIIAAISDPVERKRAADAAIASIKGKSTQNKYADIKPRKSATDTVKTAVDQSQLGRDWAEKYNPHYKKQQA
jgi:hypothetical protein